MKNIIIIFIFLFLIMSCSYSPTQIKEYQPILEILTKDTIRFELSAGDDSIWNWDDQDTVNFEIILHETNDLNAFITKISYQFKDMDRNLRNSNSYYFLEPEEVVRNSEDTILIKVILNGHYISDLDEADGDEDFVANGVFKLTASFYDDKNLTYTSRSFYKPLIVTTP